jgi:hypothetical protein
MTIKRDKLAATDFADIATGCRSAPAHPGEVPVKDVIEAMGITRYRVAKAMGVPQRICGRSLDGKS